MPKLSQCACFDYSKLEEGYQARDLALKQAILRQCPFPDEPGTSLRSISINSEAAEDNMCTSPGSGQNTSAEGERDATMPKIQWLTPEHTYQSSRGREIDEHGHLINDMLPSTQVTNMQPHGGFNTPLVAVTDENAAVMGAATQQTVVPRLMKLEIRTVLIAQEKIRNNVRRWRCQFGSSGMPGGHMCMREDDHLNTIRRHYGREHGKHRYYMKPKMRLRCGHCGLTVESRVPDRCPSCNGAGDAWVQEVYALIEVPVPLSTGGLEDGAAKAGDVQTADGALPSANSVAVATASRQPFIAATAAPWAACSALGAPLKQSAAPVETPAALAIPGGMSSTPSALGVPSTPLTPLTPLTPMSPVSASGDVFLADTTALFPYGPLDVADWQQQPLSVDDLSQGQLFCGDGSMPGIDSCDFNIGLDLDLQGAPMFQMYSSYTAEDMDWSTHIDDIYRGEEEQTERALETNA